MRQNGPPEPVFESDDERTSSLVRLLVHQQANTGPAEHEAVRDTLRDTGQDTVQGPNRLGFCSMQVCQICCPAEYGSFINTIADQYAGMFPNAASLMWTICRDFTQG